MEKLDPKQRDNVNKMSTQRLLLKLNQLGHSEDALENMQRAELLTTYAQALFEGKDKPGTVSTIDMETTRLQIERERLELERTRLQMQQTQN